MSREPKDQLDARLTVAFESCRGRLKDIALECGIHRSTAYSRLRRMGLTKPLVDGTLAGMKEKVLPLPRKGKVKRYVLTSAQNNTEVNDQLWCNLLALAKHYDAKILVGTFSYNQNKFGKLAVKRGKRKTTGSELWFDPRVEPYFSDDRLQLAHGLVWCGEMNTLPTASDPLSGLESYSQRKSAIFPHAKMAMRSIATMKGEGTKLNYTTGTVTQMNYIQKKEGLKGEHHHVYGAVLVEVDSSGSWWVRQLVASGDGSELCDLDLIVKGGKVSTGNRVEAITYGDIHAGSIDPVVHQASLEMRDALKPRYQFLHDVLEGATINHHTAQDCHELYKVFVRGLSVEGELREAASKLATYDRPDTETIVIDSNHDSAWLYRWLREHDYRRDPQNARIFLTLQAAVYNALSVHDRSFHLLKRAFEGVGSKLPFRFLQTDESFKTCDRKIENGMHGQYGPNGARGTPANLNKVGRRANTAHTHSAGIYNGLYVAGTSTTLDMEYNKGPSSWSHSHIVTYQNGARSIVTVWAGKWRA